MKAIVGVLFILECLLVLAYGEISAYNLVVQRQLLNLDGYTRDGVTINGKYIGPTIEATVGDRLLVTVTNKLSQQEVVTMHFHGVKQTGTPWADGTASVTNCPLNFGSSFTHNFTVDEPGTFWYHAHLGNVRAEGSFGMLVVYDQESATWPLQTRSKFGDYSYDAELRIFVNDWYHPSAYTLNTMLEHNPFKWVGNGDTILINGLGESKLCSYNGSTTTVLTTFSDGTQTTTTSTCKGNRAILAVEPGKTYLVRVVNTAYLGFYNLAIAGHYFTLLGTDGASFIQPVDVNSIDISAGQRYMALLRANAGAVGTNNGANTTFLVQVQSDWRGNDVTNAGIAHAYLTYGDANNIAQSDISPLVPPNESRNWHEWYDNVVALNTSGTASHGASLSNAATASCPPDSAVTKTFQIDGTQQMVHADSGRGLTPPTVTPGIGGTRLAWTVYNDSRLMLPSEPYLLTRYMSNHYKDRNSDQRSSHRQLASMSLSPAEAEHEGRTAAPRSAGKDYWDQYKIITPAAHAADQPLAPTTRSSTTETNLMAAASSSSNSTEPSLQPLRVEAGEVVDLVVQTYASGGGGCDLHPWHLHGHSFWLLARGSGVYNAETSYSVADTYISKLPLRTDTVSGYPSNYSESRAEVLSGTTVKGVWKDPCGWFKIRFVADNPGYWMFHCHIGWHMDMGMALVFDVSSELVGAPPGDYGMCGADSTYTAYLAMSTTEVVVNTTIAVVHDDENGAWQHGVAFTALVVALLVLLFVALIIAVPYLWLKGRRGLFQRVAFEPDVEAVGNPLSAVAASNAVGQGGGRGSGGGGGDVESGAPERGAVQMVSVRQRPPTTTAAAAARGETGKRTPAPAEVTGEDDFDDVDVEVTFQDMEQSLQHKQADKGRRQQGGNKLTAGLRGLRRTISKMVSTDK